MRNSLFTGCLLFTVICGLPAPLHAETDPLAQARSEARRQLDIAKLEYRLYRNVEYARELRHLKSEITFTQAEIKAYKRRLREYAPFNKWSDGSPLLVTIQNMELRLLAAELRLHDLRDERRNLQRYFADHCRLLKLRIHDARARLVELYGGGEIDDLAAL